MATIDPNIALGVRPVQIENPLNRLAAMTQIQAGQQGQQLNALKMQEAQLELEDRNALRGLDISSPDFISNVSKRNPKLALALQKEMTQNKEAGLKNIGLETKNLTDRYKQEKDIFQYISTPEQFLARSINNLNDPLLGPQLKNAGVTEATIRQRLDAATKQPGGFQQLLSENILGLDKFIELNKPQYMEQNLGGTNRITALPGLGIGAPTIVSDTKKTKTYADITAEGNLALNRQELANKYDPVLQANLAEAKAAGDYFGKNKAAAAQALPAALENATQAIRLIDEMIGTAEVRDKNGKVIKAAGKEHPGFSNYVGIGFPTRFVEGSDAASFEIRQKQIEGKAFLEAFNVLRGGGAITEKEGEKGTLAIMRMNKATSEAEYKAAARELQEVLRTGVNTMRAKAGQPSGGKGGGGGVDYDALVNKYTQ